MSKTEPTFGVSKDNWQNVFSLIFLAQYCADKTLWSLTPKLPKCRGWCAVKAVHRIAMSIFPADFWAQPPATSARWHWQCPSDTGAAVSHWLHLPGTRHGCLTGQRAFFGFCSVLERSSTPTEISHQKFIFMFWSQPNAKNFGLNEPSI